jgi:hypothetical protein
MLQHARVSAAPASSPGPPSLPTMSRRFCMGRNASERIRQIDARIPVIFITWAATADTAIEAMKEGAYDYLFKPLDLARLRNVVIQALALGRLMREPAVVAETPPRRTWATPSSAAVRPWGRCTRPSAASLPRPSIRAVIQTRRLAATSPEESAAHQPPALARCRHSRWEPRSM